MRNDIGGQRGAQGEADVPAHLRPVIERMKAVPPVTVSHDLAPEILAKVKSEGSDCCTAGTTLPADAGRGSSFTWLRRDKTARPTSIAVDVRPAFWRWATPLAAAATLALLLGGIWVWSARRTGPEVAQGPTDGTSVSRAVAWLCRTQESDGSWNTARWGGSKQFEVALTGLSLMAILGEVETPAGARRAGIDRAVEYLLGLQDEHGEFGTAFDAAPYNQGIATLALLHAYRAQKSDRVKAAIDRALAAICRRQHPDGGWGYRQEATPASNLPITLWQIEALRLAAASGWSDLRAPIGRSSRWIASVADEDGTFGYRQKRDFPEGSPTLTAMGAMSVLAGAKGVPIPPARRQAIKAQVEQLAAAPVETLDYYRRYFLAAALVRLDEESARERLSTLRRELAGRQVRQGPDRGSWLADDRWSSAGGRVYATAMASLSMR